MRFRVLIILLLLTGILIFSHKSAGAESRREGALAQAEIMILEGDYGRAIEKSEVVLGSPDWSAKDRAYYVKGIGLLKNGRADEAREAFSKILSDYPRTDLADDARLGIGDSYLSEARFQEALAQYRMIQENYQNSPLMGQVCYKQGLSCQKMGRWEEARFYFQKVLREYPLSFEAKMAQGILSEEAFYFTVQVGSFVNYGNARKLSNKLKEEGYQAYISDVKKGNATFHRVRVGRFNSGNEAEACYRNLKRRGYSGRIYP